MNINYNFYISCPFDGFQVNLMDKDSIEIMREHMEWHQGQINKIQEDEENE